MNKTGKSDDAKSGSGTFRMRKRDGREIQKKGFWIAADDAHAFEIWCVTNRRDESDVVGELIAEFLRKKKR